MKVRRRPAPPARLHRPRVHEAFGVPVQPGLTDILIGQAKLDACLHPTGVPGLRVLTAGGLPPNPVELLGSRMMADVLMQLNEKADLVIFDSPPLLATANAQVLSAKIDGTLFVMQMGRVPRSSVLHSFELLQQARANVIGIVLNKIDEAAGHTSYYGYYGDDPAVRNGSAPGTANGTVESARSEAVNQRV